jgi:UDP-N-acetylmuramate dehydrogenase
VAADAAAPGGVRSGVLLATYTTLGIGGPADHFLAAGDEGQVREALSWARRAGMPVFVLGGGSNVLFSDQGYRGLVLQVASRGIETAPDRSFLRVTAAAGEPWDDFVAWCTDRGLAGLECLSGIPGAVGATPIQNVGAYGQEVSETLVSLQAMDRRSGKVRRFDHRDCRFSYRWSVFKDEERDRHVILSVTFRLQLRGAPAVRYPELERHLAERHRVEADLATVREAVIALRRRKGMVLDPEDPDSRSDGSFFLNPVLRKGELERFLARLAGLGEDPDRVPRFPAPDGTKLSAAWLIERAGFRRGHRHGNVGLSSKHALAIVNRGGGTAREVLELAALLQRQVEERFGVRLEPEPRLLAAESGADAPSGAGGAQR